jgi:hypothetical protein
VVRPVAVVVESRPAALGHPETSYVLDCQWRYSTRSPEAACVAMSLSTRLQSRSGSSSPALACSMIFMTIRSVAGSFASQRSCSTSHTFRNDERIASMCAGSTLCFTNGMLIHRQQRLRPGPKHHGHDATGGV